MIRSAAADPATGLPLTDGCRVGDAARSGMVVPWPAAAGTRPDGSVRVRWDDGTEQAVAAKRLRLLLRAHYAEPTEALARVDVRDAAIAARCLNLSERIRMAGDGEERGDFDPACRRVGDALTAARLDPEEAAARVRDSAR